MQRTWTNLGDLIDRTNLATQIAMIDLRDPLKPVTFTHEQADRLSNGVATTLMQSGLKRGQHVAIAALNRAEYLITYFGIMRAGLIAVPINIKQSQEVLDYVLQDANIAFAFVDAQHRASFEGRVAFIDFDSQGPEGFTSRIIASQFDSVTPEPDDIAQMLYTSGSTGKPKGVPLTHKGQLWALGATLVSPSAGTQDKYLLAQPLFHMNGLFMAKRAFATNSLLVIQPSFEVNAYAAALSDFRINVVTAVPTMFARVVKDPALLAGKDFSGLKRIMLGSAPMTRSLFDRIQQVFPNARITHGYGTTEAGPAVFGPHPDGIVTPPLALGFPLKDCEVRLVGGSDENQGVLHMRNAAVLPGYHNLPTKSAEVLNDGWYNSGDVMRRDTNGFYYFVGRADDMFVCSGENIYPVEVEKLLESNPEIRQACVVALPDEERSQMPVAFIVLKPGSQLNTEDVKQHALKNGPTYQYPRRIQFVAELPWAGTNKVDRNVLIKLAHTLEADAAWMSLRQQY